VRYTAAIEVFGDKNLVYECFKPETKETKKQRSSYEVKKKRNSVGFMIRAEDSVALRAAFSSISKMLEVLEKTK
jgi:tRNA threonylcarbamoyladenosine modification (KEOPS) complex  Pcc1 subunit